jgi:hypothetical protein
VKPFREFETLAIPVGNGLSRRNATEGVPYRLGFPHTSAELLLAEEALRIVGLRRLS